MRLPAQRLLIGVAKGFPVEFDEVVRAMLRSEAKTRVSAAQALRVCEPLYRKYVSTQRLGMPLPNPPTSPASSAKPSLQRADSKSRLKKTRSTNTMAPEEPSTASAVRSRRRRTGTSPGRMSKLRSFWERRAADAPKTTGKKGRRDRDDSSSGDVDEEDGGGKRSRREQPTIPGRMSWSESFSFPRASGGIPEHGGGEEESKSTGDQEDDASSLWTFDALPRASSSAIPSNPQSASPIAVLDSGPRVEDADPGMIRVRVIFMDGRVIKMTVNAQDRLRKLISFCDTARAKGQR